jgi:hypothetical protein
MAQRIWQGTKMRKSTNTVACLIGLAILGGCAHEGALTYDTADKAGGTATVGFCDLVRNPETYDGRTVRVEAIHRHGFEWSELYCPECTDQKAKVWAELDDRFATSLKSSGNESLREAITGNGFKGRTVKLTAVGKFYGSGGGYGHQGAYEFKLSIDEVEQAEVLMDDSPSPPALPPDIRARAKCLP